MNTRCGYVAIVGKPNVGKSTLLNALLQQKISITSKKPQTTRHNVLGIRTDDDCQMLFVDTPGIHLKEHRAINRYMNRSAKRALGDVDVVLFIVDRDRWDEEDEFVSSLFAASSADKILGVNKIDLLPNRDHVLPLLQSFQAKYEQADIVPISAEKSHNLDVLTSVIRDKLPESPFYYGEEQVTDRSIRFLVAELLREKITRQLGEELPYAVTIEIDRYQDGETVTEIDATIFVEKEGQKKILVGAKGEKLKRVGIDARIDMEDLLGRKVVLNTWVKVRSGWSDDERAMRSLGYDE